MLDALSPADAVRLLLSEERRKRKAAEWRVRCYADVLMLYAHRLAIAQDKRPDKTMAEARDEVLERFKEKDWLGQ